MIPAIHCCKDCPDRYIGYHAECERYIQEKAEHDEIRKRMKKYDEEHYPTYAHQPVNVERKLKQHQKAGKRLRMHSSNR